MYRDEANATHLRLTNARIDDSLIRDIERTRYVERTKATVAFLTVIGAVGVMSLVGWIAAKFLMGY